MQQPPSSSYPYHHHHHQLRPLRAATDTSQQTLATTAAAVETASSGSSDHLESIFRAVRDQVHRWGDTARWKIELILLSDQQQDRNVSYAVNPRGDRRPEFRHYDPAPQHVDDPRRRPFPHTPNPADLERELQASVERQRYLQGIINSQAEQLQRLEQRQHSQQDNNEEIATMRKIYLLTEYEQNQRHNAETMRMQGEIEALAKRMKRITNVLRQIEVMDLSPEESDMNVHELREDYRLLLRKLHLLELRLSARDAELSYLQDLVWEQNHATDTQQHQQPQPTQPQQRFQSSPALPHRPSPLRQTLVPHQRMPEHDSLLLSPPLPPISSERRTPDRLDARQSPSIAALLDVPQTTTHATAPPNTKTSVVSPSPAYRALLPIKAPSSKHQAVISSSMSPTSTVNATPATASTHHATSSPQSSPLPRKRRWSFDMHQTTM